MEAWHPFFSIEDSFFLFKREAQSVLRFVKKNKKPRLYVDYRFKDRNLAEYLESAVNKIKIELDKVKHKDKTSGLRFTLSAIECFVLYQTLRDTNKDWASFFFRPALFNVSKCSSRGYTTIIRETEKKKLLECGSFLALHIKSVLKEFKQATGKDLLDYETPYDD